MRRLLLLSRNATVPKGTIFRGVRNWTAPNSHRTLFESSKDNIFPITSWNSRLYSTTDHDCRPVDHPMDGPRPTGNLFHMSVGQSVPSLLHKTAAIRRTFTPQCNAQVMLISGGRILAAHASFDPEYTRARSYIYNHAVGSTVLSPVLITSLIGALVEAALPQSVFESSSLRQVQPLIVGVEVEATITVTRVSDKRLLERMHPSHQLDEKSQGYEVELKTEVCRFRDQEMIATGTHCVWFPGI